MENGLIQNSPKDSSWLKYMLHTIDLPWQYLPKGAFLRDTYACIENICIIF